MPRFPNETKQTQFRFKADTLAEMKELAGILARQTGVEHSRADAVRRAVHETLEKYRKKSGKTA